MSEIKADGDYVVLVQKEANAASPIISKFRTTASVVFLSL
jgi:hypothetical protein